jgi:putative DNA primase/helicase
VNLDSVLLKFHNVKKCDNGRYYTALCPGHDDNQNSLVITPESDKILMHCQANCDFKKVLTKAGLGPDDLRNGYHRNGHSANGHKGAIVATYDYRGPDSRLLYQSVRYDNTPKTFSQRRPDGNGGYIWNMNGVERVLYRLPELIIADESLLVFIVEGEKDADRLASLGLIATTNVAGAGKWKPEYNQWLKGRNVVILPDNDQAGRDHALKVGKSLEGYAATIKIVELPDLPEKGDVSDWLDQGHTGEELLEIVENSPFSDFGLIPDEPLEDSQADEESTPEPVFKLFTFDDLMNEPDKEELIEGVIARGQLGMVFGGAGEGKTIVVNDLGIAAVLGETWAGCFNIPRPLNVAYCAGEGTTGLKARFAAAAGGRGVTGSHLGGLMVFQNVPQLFLPDYQSAYQFVNEFKRLGRPLDLLIIDTLHTAIVNADENSSKDAGTILAACRYLIQELNCALLLVHHTNKAKSGERGSSAYRGAMDIMLEVSQEGDRRILHCSKNKDGERFQSQAFGLMKWGESVYPIWEGEATRKKDNGTNQESMLSELLKRPTARLTAKQWGEAINISQSHANNVLGQLVKDGKALRSLLDESKPSSNRNPWVYGLRELES